MVKVSVIIPTYNRYDYLNEAIRSVLQQTMEDYEIIIVNDKSKDKRYYIINLKEIYGDKVNIIHLTQNSKTKFGHASAGYVRTVGIKEAKGEYIAFLDDDDIWFPTKLEKQLKAMQETCCNMSSTEGLHGKTDERYDKSKIYEKYNSEKHFRCLEKIYKDKGMNISRGFPQIWDYNFINIHNCIITSSVIVKKKILENIGYMKNLPNGKEDYDCWKRCLKHTNSVYLDDDVYFCYSSISDHTNRYEYY